jgi:NADH-quinone oxidoreductase subunit G
MAAINPVFYGLNDVASADWGEFGQLGEMGETAFKSPIDNFYMTDPISRASLTMAACTRAQLGSTDNMTGTDG